MSSRHTQRPASESSQSAPLEALPEFVHPKPGYDVGLTFDPSDGNPAIWSKMRSLHGLVTWDIEQRDRTARLVEVLVPEGGE